MSFNFDYLIFGNTIVRRESGILRYATNDTLLWHWEGYGGWK